MPTDREKLIEAVDWSRRRLSTIEANIKPLSVNGYRDQAESCQLAIRYAEQITDAFIPTILEAVSVACSLGENEISEAALSEIKERIEDEIKYALMDAREWSERVDAGEMA
ncbi:hypothetical protein ACLB6G_20475 [Zhengella sp. ZM62]|uniref:hypothetical protein n=1 Tax=Zhengella sedimenti TaxID=3390035 RepID=UPI003974CD36